MTIIHAHFKDRMTYDSASKTAVSVRDGFLEYAGAEIGKEPADKIFKVYRSPATIANVANLMPNIGLTDEHVDLDSPVENPKGKVKNATMIDLKDESTHSTLAIKNTIDVDDDANDILTNGKRELSLGYKGQLVEFDGDEYDFEQKNIVPHHLAIVDQGRCGSVCSFIDNKQKEIVMTKKQKEFLDSIKNKTAIELSFIDSAGAPNMQEIIDMVTMLPEAVKTMSIDDLKKFAPKLQTIIANAGVAGVEDAPEDEPTDEPKEPEGDKPTDEPAPTPTKDEGEEIAVKDTAEFKDALTEAVDGRVKEHTEVIIKARDFVDEKYVFTDKNTNEIMRDALAVEHGTQKFSDSELPVAFKLLKPTTDKYKAFADGQNKEKTDDIKNKDY